MECQTQLQQTSELGNISEGLPLKDDIPNSVQKAEKRKGGFKKGHKPWNKEFKGYSLSSKGKSYEDIHGEEKGKKLREKLSISHKNSELCKAHIEQLSQIKKGSIPWNKNKGGYSTSWKGGHHAPESIKLMRESHKGHRAWNKGLTKESDERVSQLSEKLSIIKTKLFKENKISPYWKGKHRAQSDKMKKRYERIKGKTYEEIYGTKEANEIKKKLPKLKGKSFEELYGIEKAKEMREKIKNFWLGKTLEEIFGEEYAKKIKEKQSKIKKGKSFEERFGIEKANRIKDGFSIALKKRWQNPEYKEKTIRNVLKALNIKPNKPETILINLFKEYNLPFNYVGDGKLIIGGKCPDFVCNPSKKVILLHGEYWHYLKSKRKNSEITKEEIEKKDIEHYKKNFFDCLIIWEHEMKNLDIVLNKVKNFIGVYDE